MSPVAGAGCQARTPDLGPGVAQESDAALSLVAVEVLISQENPDCPRCGAVMSRFPLVIYCGYCEFHITAQGGRLSDLHA